MPATMVFFENNENGARVSTGMGGTGTQTPSPLAGQTAQGHLFNATFHGPAWLTGGSTGPQGSVFAFVVVILAICAVHFAFPKPLTAR